jgi:hypothetical protein
MEIMSERDIVLVVLIAPLLLATVSLTVILLLKRASRQLAAHIRYAAGPPRWSSLELQERVRLQAKPKRLGRSHPAI